MQIASPIPHPSPWRRVATLALLAVVVGACASPAPPERPLPVETLAVAGNAMAFVHQGQRAERAPAVVFQSGLGDDHGAWAPVLQQLPPQIEAIALDRPGYGASPARDTPRDACHIAAEQRALLQRAGVKPPYVLVGHSLGGLYQYVYARMYPDEVAALVLLDPTHPDLQPTLEREQPGAAALLALARRTVFSPAAGQEFDAQTGCLDRLQQQPALAAPTQLLAATQWPVYMGAGMQALLGDLRNDWLRRTGATLSPVADSGHQIHRDAPEVVARSIRTLFD